MLKILWKRAEITPEEQFLLLSTIFCYLMLDFCVKTRIRFSLRDKLLFEITEVEITRSTVLTFYHSEDALKKSGGTLRNTDRQWQIELVDDRQLRRNVQSI